MLDNRKRPTPMRLVYNITLLLAILLAAVCLSREQEADEPFRLCLKLAYFDNSIWDEWDVRYALYAVEGGKCQETTISVAPEPPLIWENYPAQTAHFTKSMWLSFEQWSQDGRFLLFKPRDGGDWWGAPEVYRYDWQRREWIILRSEVGGYYGSFRSRLPENTTIDWVIDAGGGDGWTPDWSAWGYLRFTDGFYIPSPEARKIIWAEDGSYAVYFNDHNIFYLDHDTQTGPTRLAQTYFNFEIADVLLDSDHDRLVCITENRQVYLVRFDGQTNWLNMADTVGDFYRLSPDGKWLFYTLEDDNDYILQRMSLDDATPIMPLASIKYWDQSTPVFSADGQLIQWLGPLDEIYVMAVDGDVPTRLVDESARRFNIQFTTDGRYLIYGQLGEAGEAVIRWDITNQTAIPLSTENSFYVRHDDWVVVRRDGQLAQVRVDGALIRVLTHNMGDDKTVWYISPDGQHVFYRQSNPDETRVVSLAGENRLIYPFTIRNDPPVPLRGKDGFTVFHDRGYAYLSNDGREVMELPNVYADTLSITDPARAQAFISPPIDVAPTRFMHLFWGSMAFIGLNLVGRVYRLRIERRRV